ncbi:Os01g0213350 [Oryza sativa Japonica Group]|uniref:Os01g0213350 protein n=1 Tax=Oryza sativa subsp. japonica TaxID=39947 RepID=A0A0P0UZP5_ORYSJ|nr:Os01g0213350 [Oryza sativa Japonica Group]
MLCCLAILHIIFTYCYHTKLPQQHAGFHLVFQRNATTRGISPTLSKKCHPGPLSSWYSVSLCRKTLPMYVWLFMVFEN